MFVYICGVTAFADSFNAIHQGMYLDDPINTQDMEITDNTPL